MWIIIIAVIVLFLIWNITLFGYKDRAVHPIESDESKVFCPEARPIVLKKEGHSGAILLVHGFPATPSTYTYSSRVFFEAGLDVYVPLLPGFGTDPKEFVKTTFTQWFDYLCRYYEHLRSEYETLSVLGISMGGMMTLKIGETYCGGPKAPDKLVSIAAPVVYNSMKDGIITDWKQSFLRTVALFNPSIGARTTAGKRKARTAARIGTATTASSSAPASLGVRHEAGETRAGPDQVPSSSSTTGATDRPFGNCEIIEREQQSSDFKILKTEMPPMGHSRHALLTYYSVQADLTQRIIAFLFDKETPHDQA